MWHSRPVETLAPVCYLVLAALAGIACTGNDKPESHQPVTSADLLFLVSGAELPDRDLYFADYATLNSALGGASSTYCQAQGVDTRIGLDPTLNDPTVDWAEMIGFVPCDVEMTAMVYPPYDRDAVVVSRVSQGRKAVTGALMANQYSTRNEHGETVFSSPNEAQPEDRLLTVFNRVAVFDDGVVVRAGNDATIELAIERAKSSSHELNSVVAALMSAISEYDGLFVLGSPYVPDPILISYLPDANDFSTWGELDLPNRVALAYQRTASGEDVTIVALLYQRAAAAGRNADELQLRLSNYVSLTQRRPFCDEVSVKQQTESAGTVITARCTGGVADQWFRAVFARDLVFLSEFPPQVTCPACN